MPETFLKKGEPLPILYRIYRDKLHQEHVDSLPFPLVLSDITYLSDIIGSNINRKDMWGNIIQTDDADEEPDKQSNSQQISSTNAISTGEPEIDELVKKYFNNYN